MDTFVLLRIYRRARWRRAHLTRELCCSVLQYVAVCCRVLQCVVVGILRHRVPIRLAHSVAVCCSVLQCTAECCSVLQCVVLCCSPLPHATSTRSVCCSMLQYMSVCCVQLQLSNAHSTRRAAAPHNTTKYTATYCNTLTYQLSDAHSVCYVGLQLCESSARRRAAAAHNTLSWCGSAAAWGCSSAALRVEWVLQICSACSGRRRASELQLHTIH